MLVRVRVCTKKKKRSLSNCLPSLNVCSLITGSANRVREHLTLTGKRSREPRCPYCVLGKGFRVMKVLQNGRQICENCGHIVFPNDMAFRCPCPKCLEANFSPRIRRLRRS